jgi:hypothetical protein
LPTSKLQQLRDRLQSRGARPSVLLTTPADRQLVEAVATPEEQELLEQLADAFQMDERHATALLDELHQQAG